MANLSLPDERGCHCPSLRRGRRPSKSRHRPPLRQRLDGERDALPAADAQRDDAALEAVAPHGVNEARSEDGAGRADRMSVRNRATSTLAMSGDRPSWWITAMAMAANASLISMRSTSPIFHPARSSAWRTAGMGPRPNIPGSTAAMP